MKNSLRALMKMARHQRDQLAQQVMALEQKCADIRQSLQEHEHQWLNEIHLMEGMGTLLFDFQGFYKRFQIEHDVLCAKLNHSQKDLEDKIQELRGCFEEQKKYEHLIQEHQKAQEHKEQKSQQQALDEWGHLHEARLKSSRVSPMV